MGEFRALSLVVYFIVYYLGSYLYVYFILSLALVYLSYILVFLHFVKCFTSFKYVFPDQKESLLLFQLQTWAQQYAFHYSMPVEAECRICSRTLS